MSLEVIGNEKGHEGLGLKKEKEKKKEKEILDFIQLHKAHSVDSLSLPLNVSRRLELYKNMKETNNILGETKSFEKVKSLFINPFSLSKKFEWKQIEHIEILVLYYYIPDFVFTLKKLKTLIILHMIQYEFPTKIRKLTSLTSFILSNCHISKIPSSIQYLHLLEEFVIYNHSTCLEEEDIMCLPLIPSQMLTMKNIKHFTYTERKSKGLDFVEQQESSELSKFFQKNIRPQNDRTNNLRKEFEKRIGITEKCLEGGDKDEKEEKEEKVEKEEKEEKEDKEDKILKIYGVNVTKSKAKKIIDILFE